MREIKSLKILLIFFSLQLIISCKSNCDSRNLEKFKSEISPKAFLKYEVNSPFPFCDNIASTINYQPYFQSFGNSGIITLHDVQKESIEKVLKKIKTYKIVNPDSLVYQDSSYVYTYKDFKTNKMIKMPEIDTGIAEYCNTKSPKDKGLEIYLIENGYLKNVFVEKPDPDPIIYNYASGIYHLKNESKIIYWFIIY